MFAHDSDSLPISSRAILDDDDDDDDDDKKKHKKPVDDDDDDDDHKHTKKPVSDSNTRRKNTVISLLCSTDPLAPLMTLSFVASPDSCTYFFEARSSAACGGVETAKQQLGPSGVFGVIVTIAVLVYLVGGCVYQRTVMHQRGWRQLPNYALWAGIAGFVSVCSNRLLVHCEALLTTHSQDIFIIATSSCARFLPGRRGYNRVGTGAASSGRRGREDSDAENRLIDQLDEEWND